MITLHQNCAFMSQFYFCRHIFPSLFARFFFLITAVIMATGTKAMTTDMPKREVRAVWLTTIGGLDWPTHYSRSKASAAIQQQELCSTLDQLKRAGINTILLQTRIRATTIYPSAMEPWDGCLSGLPGTSPGYDALQFAIDDCHKRGMELHAWIVAIPIGKWNGSGCKALRKKQPGLVKRIGNEGFMNPEKKETAAYLARLCSEVVDHYDIDGVHLDYIRYPEEWPLARNERYEAPRRRACINAIVKEVATAVKQHKPWVKMSCSPIGKYDDLPGCSSRGWNAYRRVYQDPILWISEGWMDMLFPMMYFREGQFYPFLFDWKQNSCGRPVVAGLAAYMLSPKEKNWPLDEVKRQMAVCRQYGAGHALFRSRFLTDNTKGLYNFTVNSFNLAPALTPAMTWLSDKVPDGPDDICITRTDSADYLSWSGATDHSGGPYLMYNIYASTQMPVDVNRAENLVAMRVRGNSICFRRKKHESPLHYAVTAIDRYGNESISEDLSAKSQVPALTPSEEEKDALSYPWLTEYVETLPDAAFVMIHSLSGVNVRILPFHQGKVDVSSLPDGVYTIRSLNQKGQHHRLASFSKKNNHIRHIGPQYSNIIINTWKK